jgi:hypothetical protein
MRTTAVSAGAAQLSATLRPRRMDVVTRVGVWTAVGILLSVSGGLLWLLGYNYDGLTGSPLTKLHPFTYMIVAIFIWRSLAYGNPIGYGALVVSHRPASTLLIFAASCMIGLTVARGGPGIAGYVDTYIGPALLVFLLVEADERETAGLTTLLHVVMTANALLGLFEFVSKTLVFPYRLDGELFLTDTRSTALQGHPLDNATLTAIYIMGLLAGARSMPQHIKLGLVGLQCAALVVFGGRAAIVTTGLLGGLYGVRLLFGVLRSNRASLLGAAFGAAMLAVVPAAIFAVISTGYLDEILIRFASDGGSANARVQMFDLFPYLSLRDLIVGPDLGYLESLRRINGLEWGIENPIVRMTLYQGAFVTLVVLVSFGLFLRELIQGRERGTWVPILAILILLNTSESIAAKTTTVAKIVVVIACLFRTKFPRDRGAQPPGAFSPNAATIAGSSSRVRSSMIPMPSNRFQNAQGNPKASALRRTSST